jgi:hypothetical protein
VTPVIPGAIGPYSGKYPAGLVNPDNDNFAPRFGIAWRPRKEDKRSCASGTAGTTTDRSIEGS